MQLNEEHMSMVEEDCMNPQDKKLRLYLLATQTQGHRRGTSYKNPDVLTMVGMKDS